jgi:hypothetical protein
MLAVRGASQQIWMTNVRFGSKADIAIPRGWTSRVAVDRDSSLQVPMSALGQKRTLRLVSLMPALPPKADIEPVRCSEKRLFDHAARHFVTRDDFDRLFDSILSNGSP